MSAPSPERACPTCQGEGTIRLMTSHLGPDDYEYDEQCPACDGCGSSNPKDAIDSLPYSQHGVRGVAFIERSAVLRIVEAHLAVQAAALAAARRQALEDAAQAAGPDDSYQDEWFKAKADAARRIRALITDPIPTGEAQESDFGAFEDAQGKQG